MTALRWLLGLAAALVVAVLLAGWIVPPFLDGERFRASVALLASEALGQRVRIDGPVVLRLLPEPVLTAGDVAVAEGARGVSVTAASLQLRVAPWPLLSGHVDARELVLRGVDARLPWPLGQAALALHAPGWLSALSARVDGGTLHIGDMAFGAIQASLSTRDDTGTWVVAGTAEQGGKPWHFTARLSRPGADGSASVDVTLDAQGPGTGTGAALSGQIAGDGTVTGRVSGRGTDLSAFLPAPAVPFRAEGRFVMGDGLAFVDELSGEIGGSPVQGAVSFRLLAAPRLDVSLAASRLDLDAWLPRLLRGGGLVGRLPIGVDLSAEAAQLAGGTLRRLRGGIEFADGVIHVREARAVLPGEAALRLDGTMAQAGFSGTMALDAPALRTTLAWAKAARIGNVDALPPLVLRSAELSAHLATEAGQIILEGLNGRLDGTAITGNLRLRPGEHPALAGSLSADKLDLGAWLPASWTLPGLAGQLGGIEGELQLKAASAVLGATTLAPFELDAAAQAREVRIRRLAFASDGVDVVAGGALGEAGRISDGRLQVHAANGLGLARLLPELPALVALRQSKLWEGAASLTAEALGPPDALALRIIADLGDLHAEAQPVVNLATRAFAGSVLLRHPGAPRLLDALGLSGLSDWVGDGSIGLVSKLSARDGSVSADGFDLSAGALHAAGSLSLAPGAVPMLTGRLVADTLPVKLPAAQAREPMPLGWLTGWRARVRVEVGEVIGRAMPPLRKVLANASLWDGVLRLDDLSGQLAGGQIAGSLRLDTTSEAPEVTVNLGVEDFALGGPLFGSVFDLSGGRISAALGLTARGFSPAALLSSLGGSVRLTAQGGALDGVALGSIGTALEEATLRTAFAGGETHFDTLEIAAQVVDGIITLDKAEMRAAFGSLTASGSIDLPARQIDARLNDHPAIEDPPPFGLRLTGPMAAPERTPELAGLIPWRAARGL